MSRVGLPAAALVGAMIAECFRSVVGLGLAGLARPQLPRGGALRVWVFVAALAGAAGGLYAAKIGSLAPIVAGPSIPWGILAVLFFVAEVKVVHFHFRRDAHTFSLSEVPFVVGLFFTPPQWFLVALLLGSGAALAFHRRQSLLKLAFNLAQVWLTAEVALLVLHEARASAAILGLEVSLVAFLATLAYGLLGVLAITVAISLSEGRLQLEKLPTILKISTVVTVTNTSVALVAVTVLWREPAAAWLLVIPIVTLYLAYRAYVAERQKHERLELLYESTRIIQQAPEPTDAIAGLLRHAEKMFRAEFAEIVLRPRGPGDAVRTTVGPDTRVDLTVPVPDERALVPDDPGGEAGRIVVVRGEAAREARSDGRHVRNAMITPLRGEAGALGTLMVANRLGDVTVFDAEDLRLFETMANHLAVAIENGQLEQSLARMSELKEELQYQAYHDPLTALGNRTLLVQRIEERLGRRAGDLVPVVLFLDLDDFKVVNDRLGHAAGDAVLAEVGERIRACLRSSDVAARLGGDEFAVLLVDRPDLRNAQRVAARIGASIREPFVLDGGEARIRVSVGIAAADLHTSTAEDLMRDADVAMYTAKARGKAQMVVFEPAMQAAVLERNELGEDLQRAIAAGEFTLHYQPIVDLRTRRIRGFEALVRWRHPERGLIHPNAFVSVAEEIGIIVPLGRWVLREACQQVAVWNRSRPDEADWTVSVNVSARQLQQTTFVGDVAAALAASGLAAALLTVEVTEAVMLQDPGATAQTLGALRALGVRIAVDDFGTGESSLASLRRFPVDILKMARELTQVRGPAVDVALAHAILALARTLGLEVVAEGIEHEAQLIPLYDLRCELAQGYFFGRPLPAERMESVLRAAPADGEPAPRRPDAAAAGRLATR